jgi:hypothetical protein
VTSVWRAYRTRTNPWWKDDAIERLMMKMAGPSSVVGGLLLKMRLDISFASV